MSSNGGINITKYLLGNTKPSVGNFKVYPNAGTGVTSSLSRIISYIAAILIVILVILLFINFFITPIFRLRPGAPGIIPIPGFDDGKLFWNNTSPGQIQNKNLPIVAQTYNYTVNLDVFIENPLQFSTSPRVFFSRGGVRKERVSGDTLLSVFEYYNLVAALLPDTNDLIVSVLNKDNNMENVVIPNISVQEPIRLTMVVMEQALEVYINGHLMKTRTFSAPPKDIKGDIYPTTGIETNAIKVRNLKIWKRLLTVAEIRQATPSLSTVKDFGAGPMPSSVSSLSCNTTIASTSISNMETSTEQGIDRLTKLSVDTIPDTDYKLI